MRVGWTELALDRVDEIARYIARDDRGAALLWAATLFAAGDQLSEFPESGRVVPELEAHGVRELVHGAYRVFYRVDATVTIMSVRHAGQLVRPDELTWD